MMLAQSLLSKLPGEIFSINGSMKRALTLSMISGIALAGCTTANGTADSVSNTANDGYQSVKTAAKDTAAVVSAGATEAAGHAENLGGATKDGAYSVTDHIADWIRPSPHKDPLPISASYCYHVYQDILCYRQPMPGWEFRLAGYQPLTAEPPMPAMMQPLPVHASDASKLPANRVASSKPVFTELPKAGDVEKPADEAAAPAAAAASDASHEQLPDPALAPQL